jgi:hypothetical protein
MCSTRTYRRDVVGDDREIGRRCAWVLPVDDKGDASAADKIAQFDHTDGPRSVLLEEKGVLGLDRVARLLALRYQSINV